MTTNQTFTELDFTVFVSAFQTLPIDVQLRIVASVTLNQVGAAAHKRIHGTTAISSLFPENLARLHLEPHNSNTMRLEPADRHGQSAFQFFITANYTLARDRVIQSHLNEQSVHSHSQALLDCHEFLNLHCLAIPASQPKFKVLFSHAESFVRMCMHKLCALFGLTHENNSMSSISIGVDPDLVIRWPADLSDWQCFFSRLISLGMPPLPQSSNPSQVAFLFSDFSTNYANNFDASLANQFSDDDATSINATVNRAARFKDGQSNLHVFHPYSPAFQFDVLEQLHLQTLSYQSSHSPQSHSALHFQNTHIKTQNLILKMTLKLSEEHLNFGGKSDSRKEDPEETNKHLLEFLGNKIENQFWRGITPSLFDQTDKAEKDETQFWDEIISLTSF